MKARQIDWSIFKNEDDILEYLSKLPRYRNTPLKSAFYRFLFFSSVLKCRILNLRKPLFVVLVTNNKCNLDCTYCYGNYSSKNETADYSTMELLKIIDSLKDMGTRLLTLHGGESLLRPDIGEIINYAKFKGFYVSFNSNGYLVPLKIKELKRVDSLCISLDGKEESNDRNRGRGCYKKAIEAIEVARKNNIPVVIHATLMKDNIQDMRFLAELAKEKRVRVQFSILYNYAELKDKIPGAVTSDAEIRETIKKIAELRNEKFPIYYSNNVLQTAVNWPFSYDEKFFVKEDDNFPKSHKFIPCYHGKLKIYIDADGRVITCWAHNVKDAPNIRKLGIKQAIEQCRANNRCKYCAFLANNEQNGLLHLSPRNIVNILRIQIEDTFKIKP